MAILHEIQPDRNDPIEYTHFDCWFAEDGETDITAYHDADIEELIAKTQEILEGWEKTLNTSIIDYQTENFGSLECAINAVGYENFWNLVLFQLLSEGWDVYSGDNFIEIYESEKED